MRVWCLDGPRWCHPHCCGFAPSQNKVSRDPSSYVKLSVGKKTYTSKVRKLGVSPWGSGGPNPSQVEKQKTRELANTECQVGARTLPRYFVLFYLVFKVTSHIVS